MSKYDLSWKNFRLGHGLYWRKNYPTIQDIPNGKTALIIALCGFLLISLVVAVQYQNEAVKAVNLAEKRANQLGDCAQGDLRMVTTDDNGDQAAIVCKKAEEFNI